MPTVFAAESVTTACCRSRCVDRGDQLYMYDRDSDYRDRGYYHRRPGFELYGPGFGVEVDR